VALCGLGWVCSDRCQIGVNQGGYQGLGDSGFALICSPECLVKAPSLLSEARNSSIGIVSHILNTILEFEGELCYLAHTLFARNVELNVVDPFVAAKMRRPVIQAR